MKLYIVLPTSGYMLGSVPATLDQVQPFCDERVVSAALIIGNPPPLGLEERYVRRTNLGCSMPRKASPL
jgi:hypothetical protein